MSLGDVGILGALGDASVLGAISDVDVPRLSLLPYVP